MITRAIVGEWLQAYLNREIDAAYVARWASTALSNGRIYPGDEEAVYATLVQLQHAASRGNGFTWEQLCAWLDTLGYEPQVTLEAIEDPEGTALPTDILNDSEFIDSAPLGG